MFTVQDFEIFNEPTLAGRMQLIKTVIDPKFDIIAPKIIATLTTPNHQFYAHVAKHLRRFKNPPVDTWVAFSEDARRYKALPHFELGLWPDRLFIYLDILDEAKLAVQQALAPADLQRLLTMLPTDFVISNKHSVAETLPATAANVVQAGQKFQQYKHSELVMGRAIKAADQLLTDPSQQLAYIVATFEALLPIYQPIMAAIKQN